jgi:hypothetical protein
MTAQEYFSLGFEDGTRMDAVRSAGLSYGTVHTAAHGGKITADVADKLQRWSISVGAQLDGGQYAYISAALTLGLSEPSEDEIRKAAG